MNRSVTVWLAAVLLLGACTPSNPPRMASAPPDRAIVYVIERGWHTDIGLPVEEITGPLAVLQKPFPGVRFLSFGFGERQFLTDHKKTFGAMLKALLPSRSALLMTVLNSTPQDAFGQQHVVVLHLSHDGLERIKQTLWQELEKSPAGEPVLLADGPYPGSVFFAAADTYSGFYTCNTWTATMLHAGGLPMPTAGVLFVGQVMGMARWIGASQTLEHDRVRIDPLVL